METLTTMTLTITENIPKEKAIPILKHSIERELDFLSVGLRKTQQRLDMFREKYHVAYSEEAHDIPSLERVEWEGEEVTLARLQEKIQILKNIRFS